MAGPAHASFLPKYGAKTGILPWNQQHQANLGAQDENDDYCSSCGGNGELVCCDGCTRSFHLTCVDPPMEEGHLPDEWYCHVCFSQRFPTRLPDYGGVFGYLLNNLEKKNSSAFRLPADVRDYFEGVKTGADGEYEEILPTGKTK